MHDHMRNHTRSHLRTMTLCGLAVTGILAAALTAAPALAAGELMDVEGYPSLVRKPVEIWSDGTRLAGDVFYPKATAEGEKLPTIVLCHGWGGVKAHLNRGIAPRFAAAGYLVLAFDYRGWGESDPRLVVRGKMPEPDEDGYVTVKAQAIRQLVDPLDQQEDIDAAITFVEGEPHADPSRIGIWGSSFGGGPRHLARRSRPPREGGCGPGRRDGPALRPGGGPGGLKGFHRTAILRARGEVEPVPVGGPQPEGLTGSPYYERFAKFSPVEHAHLITAPTIIIDAKQEHYFDIREHGQRVAQILSGRVPVEYHAWDMTHYDVYSGDWLDKAMAAEIDFFDRHLK